MLTLGSHAPRWKKSAGLHDDLSAYHTALFCFATTSISLQSFPPVFLTQHIPLLVVAGRAGCVL